MGRGRREDKPLESGLRFREYAGSIRLRERAKRGRQPWMESDPSTFRFVVALAMLNDDQLGIDLIAEIDFHLNLATFSLFAGVR